MTTNYHTAIPTNSAANASTFNVPLGQLDNAISQILDGSNTFSKLVFSAASTLVISSGSITPTNNVHLVQSESGSTDNLDTITAVNNSFLFLKAVGGHTITLTGSGNIVGQSIVLTGNAIIGLFCHNNQWSVIGKSIGVRSGFEYIWQEPGANFYSPPIPSTVDQAIERLANRTNAVYSAGSIVGLECDVDDDTIVTVRSGWAVGRFSAGLMRLGSDSSVDLSVSGIGGLDTGSLTSDT